jgi:hypothetical protein
MLSGGTSKNTAGLQFYAKVGLGPRLHDQSIHVRHAASLAIGRILARATRKILRVPKHVRLAVGEVLKNKKKEFWIN